MTLLMRRTVLLWFFMLAPLSAIAGDIVGNIIAFNGEVTLRDDKAQTMDAKVGMHVETGQLIKTGAGSTAELRLADGSVFRIAAKSTFIIDDFLIQDTDSRQMTARMLTGALQYISKPALFKKDDRKIFLANAAAAIRGTDFIAFIDRRIEAVLISGKVELSARSNTVMLDRRGQSVTFDSTSKFDKAVMLSDDQLVALGERLGWQIDLPPPPEEGAVGIGPIPCTLVGKYLVCG